MLLLEPNQLVPAERLIDAVWSESPPPTARGQIHTCVSALRRTFDRAGLGERILTRKPGYILRVDDAEVDVHHFDRLVGEGRAAMAADRPADAVRCFRSALGLWRGAEPLSGIDSEFLRAAVTGLNERRLTIAEQCHAAELDLGHHRELVEQLVYLVDRYPLRERLRCQLMVALYRSGRAGEALAVYRAARRTSVAELGIEPGESLQRLHSAILDHDAALDLPVTTAATAVGTAVPVEEPPATAGIEDRPVARMLPADTPWLTGRHEIASSAVAHLAAEADAVAAIVLTGRAGIGKTALAVHIGHRLTDLFPDGQLYVRLEDERGEPLDVKQIIEQLLVALGVTGTGMPDSLEERAATYRSALARRRVIIVLDGAVDNAQILTLLPGSPTCGVLVTSRYRLAGVPGARIVELSPLVVQHAIDLLVALVGAARVSAEPAAAFELIELCEGVPLALHIAGERLAARPQWTVAGLAERLRADERRLDELSHGDLDIRAGITRTYLRFGPAARRLFRLWALVEGPDFPAWIAGPLLDDHGTDARDELDQLVAAQMIEVDTDHDGGHRYRMPTLLRLYARELLEREETPASRATALGRLLGAWQSLAEQAHHRAFSATVTVIHSDADRWPLPAGLVQQLLCQPLRWLAAERANLVEAVRQAGALGLTELCWDLAITLVGLFQFHGHLDDWRSTHMTALAACQQAGNPRGEAVILHSLATLDMVEQRYDEAAGRLVLAQRTFEEVGDDHGRSLCLRSGAFLNAVGTTWLSAATTRRGPARTHTAPVLR